MRVWKFGDDIDTDAIIPGRFLTIYDPAELAKHVFEGTRDEFAREVREGDVVVAGSNFGCGSSREHAPLALRGAGIRIIIAESFARIFYRNAVNIGLLPLVCSGTDEIQDGDAITVDIGRGFIEVNGKRLAVEPVPGFLQRIVEAGGLVAYAKNLDEVETCSTG
ncbi:MAG TPA: 3-isopropylmalate dehydratase small subunit [Candidatus Methanoculleus thermohydrogenotrophicum]|jgi:3-isopropylmalate/(R)-2-methylmalate dehydratase small subunit|nr:3-isopropylmalate dehydratase small subunit [Candidatus Methanoculleus thermohydrogenotrophicum]NLM82441.1 3-isopropylmalate dehydratase small subunit [Candidatus Methanoculleus thermohydrogenotrophicum]HOB18495.1 3-isopropylmalate dehydratase small subunit [Candidatus Methanoculleus thermohydrogenotrophicum]HPZ38602.1 3-isopropylmalate dehydratase small subunit [Candidatus Methanoculleus thermohydrogenotrophicum]HQC91747.1 3-isopropylmalate dehydratase small subunit [Candidatus Methanoculle